MMLMMIFQENNIVPIVVIRRMKHENIHYTGYKHLF